MVTWPISLKVNNPETDWNQLSFLLHLLINIKFSFQWYQLRKVLQEKQIHPLYHRHVTHSLKVNNPRMEKNQLQTLLKILNSIKLVHGKRKKFILYTVVTWCILWRSVTQKPTKNSRRFWQKLTSIKFCFHWHQM